MPRRKQIPGAFGVILVFLLASPFPRARESKSPDSLSPVAQTFPLADAKDLEESGVKAEAVEYKGREAVRVTCPAAGATATSSSRFPEPGLVLEEIRQRRLRA
jgi:hypothetical protein